MKKIIVALMLSVTAAGISGCATGQLSNSENFEASTIKNVRYDTNAGTLVIAFDNQQAYKFIDVPPDAYLAMMNAKSQAKYFNNNINGTYRYETVE